MQIRQLDENEILDAENLYRELFFVTSNTSYDEKQTKDFEKYLGMEKNVSTYLGIYDTELLAFIAYHENDHHISLISHRDVNALNELLTYYNTLVKEEGKSTYTITTLSSSKDFFEKQDFIFLHEVRIDSVSFIEMEYLIGREYLGKKVHVTIDHPYGSFHPHYGDTLYPLNYGYIDEKGFLDASFQNAYVYGIEEPLETFYGIVIAIIYRASSESIWIVSNDTSYDQKDVINAIGEIEQHFASEIIWYSKK